MIADYRRCERSTSKSSIHSDIGTYSRGASLVGTPLSPAVRASSARRPRPSSPHRRSRPASCASRPPRDTAARRFVFGAVAVGRRAVAGPVSRAVGRGSPLGIDGRLGRTSSGAPSSAGGTWILGAAFAPLPSPSDAGASSAAAAAGFAAGSCATAATPRPAPRALLLRRAVRRGAVRWRTILGGSASTAATSLRLARSLFLLVFRKLRVVRRFDVVCGHAAFLRLGARVGFSASASNVIGGRRRRRRRRASRTPCLRARVRRRGDLLADELRRVRDDDLVRRPSFADTGRRVVQARPRRA